MYHQCLNYENWGYHKRTIAPTGAWRGNFPPFYEIMTYQPTDDQPTSNQRTIGVIEKLHVQWKPLCVCACDSRSHTYPHRLAMLLKKLKITKIQGNWLYWKSPNLYIYTPVVHWVYIIYIFPALLAFENPRRTISPQIYDVRTRNLNPTGRKRKNILNSL